MPSPTLQAAARPRYGFRPHRPSARGVLILGLAAWTLLIIATAGAAAQASNGTESAQVLPAADLGTLRGAALLMRDGAQLRALPLLEESFELDVTGALVRGRLHQEFSNPTDRVIEAVFAFPLPPGAAVDDMQMRVGTRVIAAEVREKAEARVAYETARRERKKAALVEQTCRDCFRVSVAGINPSETVAVMLQYRQEAEFAAGVFRLAVPLTATPRYDAGEPAVRDRSRAVSSEAFRFAGAARGDVPRAAVRVRLDAGAEVGRLASPTHELDVRFESGSWVAETRPAPAGGNRDFVLEWTLLTGESPLAVSFLETVPAESPDAPDRYGLIALVPPGQAHQGAWLPSRTLFVVDVSGSMAGPSIVQARSALGAALERLGRHDEFNVLAFNHEHQAMSGEFLPTDAQSLAAARDFVRGLGAGGGTEIHAALHAAIGLANVSAPPHGVVQRIVFLTDGAVSDVEGLLEAASRDLGSTRIHAIGLGHAPNRSFLRRLARAGRGLSEFITPEEALDGRIDKFFARLERPVLTNLELELEGATTEGVYPAPLPDLHAGEPLLVSYRLTAGEVPAAAVLRALSPDGPREMRLPLRDGGGGNGGIAARWAAQHVRSVLDERGPDDDAARREIVELARRFRLVTPFTSLVAVEQSPSAWGPSERHNHALGLPPGASVGALPRGGTAGRLIQIVGGGLLAMGALLLLLPGLPLRVRP